MGLFRLILLLVVAWFVYRAIRQYLQGLPKNAQSPFAKPGPQTSHRPRSQTPYDVLGVSPGASQEQIRTAYQQLIQQYHPDRYDNMAAELRELAELRTKEITAAYNALKRR